MAEQTGAINYSNNNGFNNTNALQVRLDVTSVLKDIENFLRGSSIEYLQDKDGNITTTEIKTGEPKCNKQGVQSILSFLRMIINTQTVQGNFVIDDGNDSNMYFNYVANNRTDLTEAMLQNMNKWSIGTDEAELIVDSIMNIVIPFMTRLIGNKERESYSNTIRHEEKNTISKEDNKFKLFA